MRLRFVGGLIAGVTAAVMSPPIRADVDGGTRHYRYEVYYGGLHAADFALSLGGTDLDRRFRMATRGVTDWLTRLRLAVVSRGGWPAAGGGRAEYRVDFSNRWRKRRIEVEFPTSGPAVARIDATPPGGAGAATAGDEKDDAEQVPEAMRHGTLDPLHAFAEAIARVRRGLAGGVADFVLPVYDGRRRFDVAVAFRGRVVRTIGRARHDAYVVRLTTKPIAGFRPEHRVLWNDTAFDLYLSADGRFVPLQVDAVGPGPIINLVEACAAPCPLAPAN